MCVWVFCIEPAILAWMKQVIMIIHLYSIRWWLRSNKRPREGEVGIIYRFYTHTSRCAPYLFVFIKIWMYVLGHNEWTCVRLNEWAYTVQIKYIIILAEISSNLIHMSKIYCWIRIKTSIKWTMYKRRPHTQTVAAAIYRDRIPFFDPYFLIRHKPRWYHNN